MLYKLETQYTQKNGLSINLSAATLTWKAGYPVALYKYLDCNPSLPNENTGFMPVISETELGVLHPM